MYRAVVFASAIIGSVAIISPALAQEFEDITYEDEVEIFVEGDEEFYYEDEEVIVIEDTYNWDGFYIGVQGAYAHLEGSDRFRERNGFDGGIGGLFAGYNYVYRNVFIGAEIEGNIWGFGGSLPNSTVLDSDYMLAAKARFGIVWQYIMAYVNAGVATSEVTARNPMLGTGSDKQQMTGWTVGAGIEALVAENLALRLDYAHVDYHSRRFEIGGTSFREELDADVVRVGISYRFNSPIFNSPDFDESTY
ncbi:porin family protein [Rhodobacteraceae bacterium RKSG542]|uniref:outer membrane protein n=1 Tax=Pseudovibrio flavus TaxID=2529854 RepID=UPI0012BBCD60|nr:outer membrane beta-barrel protein [Pseudovibrio flavus]MTI17840.1 porin family protein [Pseudovibrio flavus]